MRFYLDIGLEHCTNTGISALRLLPDEGKNSSGWVHSKKALRAECLLCYGILFSA